MGSECLVNIIPIADISHVSAVVIDGNDNNVLTSASGYIKIHRLDVACVWYVAFSYQSIMDVCRGLRSERIFVDSP